MFKKKFVKKYKEPLWKSFYFAFQGIKDCLFAERNMMIHFWAMLIVIACGFIFDISDGEWIICIIMFGLVISAELLNTAIEATVDICMPEINPKAKLAKDTAAGAVLVTAIAAIAVGFIIFLPKIIV